MIIFQGLNSSMWTLAFYQDLARCLFQEKTKLCLAPIYKNRFLIFKL